MPVSKQHLNATVSAGLTLCAPRRTERHTVSVNVCGEEGGGHYFVRVLCIGPPNMVWGARVPQSSMQEAHVVVSAPALFRWILTERTRKSESGQQRYQRAQSRIQPWLTPAQVLPPHAGAPVLSSVARPLSHMCMRASKADKCATRRVLPFSHVHMLSIESLPTLALLLRATPVRLATRPHRG